jgi:hypothetical protein
MQIFNVNKEGSVTPTEEILLIYPFSEIWNRDYTGRHSLAAKEFTYIEFMCSPKKTNPFYGYTKESIRSEKIIEKVFRNSDWKPDDLILEGMKTYRELLKDASPSLSYLESAFSALNKLKDFFNNVNLDARTPKGALLYKPRDVTIALGDSEKVLKQLLILQDKVQQEMLDSGKTKRNRVISIFEE